MGHTYAEVRVHSPRLLRHEDVKLLVDTGSTYTWISKSILEQLEIKPRGTRRFKTIDGRLLERNVSETMVECMNELATTIVVFAEEGDTQVLGVYALEGLGLEVDPVTKELRKAESMLAI
ncbi:MAG: retroviral-like aspartic protease family protein [archaeon]|nr:retroviral-like aspartic protease family protein [archaeon]MCP8321446.1 retroviral-like aspartic protease family protein [archaeon]